MNTPVPQGGYTAERLTQLTGVTGDRIERLHRSGLLQRSSDGAYTADAVDRLTLVSYASRRGISDSQIEEFCADQGDLLASLLRTRTPSGAAHTVDEALAQLPRELFDDAFLTALLELVGPSQSDPITDEDLAALQMTGEALSTGLPAEALLQLIRVMAETLDRVADTESRVFHDYVHERNRADGLTGQQLLAATDAVSAPLLAMAEPALLYLHRRALHRAMREDFVRHLTEDTRAPVETPGEAPATILFIDLAGFTPLTLTMGDRAAADVLARFASIVRTTAGRRHGRIIKQIGDAFMLTFDKPEDAVLFGVDVCGQVATESHFPPVHIGAHHGSVLYRDGDYVGTTVNLAARVASATAPGQFLVTDTVATAIGDRQVRVRGLPPATLKGIDTPTHLFEVQTPQPGDASRDPVCGMLVQPGAEAATARAWTETYRFCSTDCHRRFVDDPARFVERAGAGPQQRGQRQDPHAR